MTDRIVDLFAGPGGWDEALRMLSHTGHVVGVEWDQDACRTAKAARHARIRADVAELDPQMFGSVTGLIASPPCQAWSMAGKRKGEQDRANCHALADRMASGDDSIDWTTWEDPRSPLVCQPIRWVRDLRPEWVALEEVPAVASLWEHYARILRGWGYSAWTGDLCAADYGVPQTRTRRILIASRVGRAGPPEPTHAEVASGPDLLGGPGRARWVSMAEALGWGDAAIGYRLARGEGITERHGDRPDAPMDLPAPTITGTPRSAAFVAMGDVRSSNGTIRPLDHPAPTITGALDNGNYRWMYERPATTVVGTFRPDVIAAPGYRTTTSRQNAPGSVRVTVEQAAVLQSFPADYPWQGSQSKRFLQVGNAVPPLLAAHVLAPLIGLAPLESSC